MKLKDFEHCVTMLGLELLSVTLSERKPCAVIRAMAVKKLSKKKCIAYHWYYGSCRKSIGNMSYGDIRNNISMYERKAPLSWIPHPPYSITELERKCFGEKAAG